MTNKEALRIVETYNYWKGGADTIGQICINPYFLEAQKKYDEAISIIEKQDKILEILKNQIDIKRGLDTFSKKPVYVIEPKKFAFALSEEKGELIKEWLENE